MSPRGTEEHGQNKATLTGNIRSKDFFNGILAFIQQTQIYFSTKFTEPPVPLLPVLSNIKSLIGLHLFRLWIVNHLYTTRQARRNWFLIIFWTNCWY